MNLWLAFIGGIIVGWVIEWVIDWYYWRRGAAEWYAVESALRSRLESAESELATVTTANDELRRQLEQVQSDNVRLRTRLGLPTTEEATPPGEPSASASKG